jgi:hypothetical protein
LAILLSRLRDSGIKVPGEGQTTAGRYYPAVDANGQRLRIINDATIRPPDTRPATVGHLCKDLRDAAGDGSHLLANVNRGVLIEEFADAKLAGDEEPYAAAIAWLVSPRAKRIDTYIKESIAEGSFYSTALFCLGNEEKTLARLHVVSLDALSLLEKTPTANGASITGLGTSNAKCGEYRVMELNSEERWNTPAGQLLAQLVAPANFEGQACGGCPAAGLCPVLANVQSLREETGGKGLLSLFRAAEIVTGRLFTYRDLWSLIATVVVGPPRTEQAGEPVCRWIQTEVTKATSNDDQERRRAIVGLQLHRSHQSLFPNRLPSPLFCGLQTWRITPAASVPALANLVLTDPARDVSESWAASVSRAMEEWAFRESPLRKLKAANKNIRQYSCQLDEEFEQVLLAWIAGEKVKDNQRRDHLRWLGTSYYRMLALTESRPGQADLIEQWIMVRTHVDQGQAHILDGDLHEGLAELLFPRFRQKNFETACLLPLFTSRVDPVRGPQERPILCAAVPRAGHNAVRLEYEVTGDTLWVRLMAGATWGGGELARLPLDYYTCREAIVSAKGRGFTEAGATTVPRVERLRASLVSLSKREPSLVIVGNMAIPASPVPGL